MEAALTDSDIFAIRSATEDCELSRTCSLALWSPSLRQRAAARRKLAGMVRS